MIWVNQRSLYKKLTTIKRNSSTETLAPEYELISTVKEVIWTMPNVLFRDASVPSQIDLYHADQIYSVRTYKFDPSISTMNHRPLPGQQATLFINNQETSINLPNALRCAATTPDYIANLLIRHPQWTPTVIHTIDWQIHHAALRKLTYGQKKTIKKFIHDWLPTNAHPSCSQHICTTKCPHCNADDETQQHFINCPVPTLLWDEIISDITTMTKKLHLDPILAELILQSMANRHSQFEPNIPNLPNSYKTLVTQQTKLGWTEIIKGRFTQQWVKVQDKYSSQTNGHLIFSRLIHYIYIKVLQVWQARCNMQHGITESAAAAKIINQLTPAVQALYSTRSKLLQLDQLLFDVPIQEVLKKPIKQLEIWISRTTRSVKQGLHRAKMFDQHQTPSIRHYFPPVPATHSSANLPTTTATASPSRSLVRPRSKSSQRPPLTIDTDSDTSSTSLFSRAPRSKPPPIWLSSPDSSTTIRPHAPPSQFEAQNYKLP